MDSVSSRNSIRGEAVFETSFGERFVFRDTAADTGGELLRMDLVLDPGVRRPLHTHPKQNERFVVHSGTLGLAIEKRERFIEGGEAEIVPAGTSHTIWNAGDGELRLTTEHRPALRFEAFVRSMVHLDREGGLDSDGVPANPFVAAAMATEFRDEVRPANVSIPARRLLFPILARIGNALGYGVPEYPEGKSEIDGAARPR